MSGSRRSGGPVRQLSLQQPAPHRLPIRRQRSAEDDKSLQLFPNPIARGRIGQSAKCGAERPKVRVAWSENRRKNEKQIEQVEVVARQIPGRSRPTTGKSRGFVGTEKASILYSRQELAERLRLAWKHREENKANIDIFLAHTTVEERCDSEMSNHAAINTPSTPVSRTEMPKLENTITDRGKIAHEQRQRSKDRMDSRKNHGEKETKNILGKSAMIFPENDNGVCNVENDKHERSPHIEHIVVDLEKTVEHRLSEKEETGETEEEQTNKVLTEPAIDTEPFNVKKKPLTNIDCRNDQCTPLPSIELENTTGIAKVLKDDFSMAKQKRASFHSGANKAFLIPMKLSTEYRNNSVSEKMVSHKIVADATLNVTEKTEPIGSFTEVKDNSANDKMTIVKSTVTIKNNTAVDKTTSQKISDTKSSFVSEKMISTDANGQEKDNFINDRNGLGKNTTEIRCSSVAEKNISSRKIPDIPKVEQKSRRTNSAPPQRNLGNNSSNRVQVNIVIATPSSLGPSGKGTVYNCQEKLEVDQKDTMSDKPDNSPPKISCERSIRSAPLKKRSKSAKRRYWGANSCKNDEDGKSRNRSNNRGKNSLDCKTMDVVTMVSLVSSADSDSDAETSPGDDKLINELRSKLPTASIIKTSINSALNIARKPIKSVSFQRESFDENLPKEQPVVAKEEKKATQARFAIVNNRGNGGNSLSGEETVSWRTDIPGLALPVLALIHDVEEAIDVPLTDREKRCLAVPIGDLHDKKRKLLRTRSIPSRSVMEKQIVPMDTKEQEPPNLSRADSFTHQNKATTENPPIKVDNIPTTPAKETDQEIPIIPSAPHFQTTKEKECWHLYRRMCDKGVYVSFDTVLRGMLTPTEYRLRQKELSQDLQ